MYGFCCDFFIYYKVAENKKVAPFKVAYKKNENASTS